MFDLRGAVSRLAVYDSYCAGGAPFGRSYIFVVSAACPARQFVESLGLSGTVVRRLFSLGQLSLSSAPETPLAFDTLLNPGEKVLVRPRTTHVKRGSSSFPLTVLYEDPFVLAVEKRAGILVHDDGSAAVTLTSNVQAYLDGSIDGTPHKVPDEGLSIVPQALQRLDLDTTGVVLFSKCEEFQCLFDALIASGGARKRYLAIVRGVFPRRSCVYSDPIGRDRHDASKMRVTGSGGKPALTEVERLAVSADGSRSLLGVSLGTGRRHQIRVHLSHHGFPIVNDPLYGSVEDGSGLMLHAFSESFVHPVTGERVDIRSPWPSRFSRWFDERSLDEKAVDGVVDGSADEALDRARPQRRGR